MHGIVEPDLGQYTHLGDGSTKTDNRVFDPALAPLQTDGTRSGTPDDRWVFTSKSTPLEYGSAAGLAAASRALRGYRDALADECLATARRVWDDEHSHAPDLFHHGNTTGGDLEEEELRGAAELLLATREARYAQRIDELWPAVEAEFGTHAIPVLRALPLMDEAFAAKVRARAAAYREEIAAFTKENPFGVPIARGGWAGNGRVIAFANTTYLLHEAFPDLFGPEHTLRALDYLYGCHPGSDISFVSAVGTHSKTIAYGNNRADFSFIAGGIVPGVLVLEPDFPENKEDWPFLWGENEYVVNLGASYLFAVHAADDLVRGAR